MLNKSYFKPIKNDFYIVNKEFSIHNTYIPKNAVVWHDTSDNTLYFCNHFPINFQGKAHRIKLDLMWYNLDTRRSGNCMDWGLDSLSSKMFIAWKSVLQPREKYDKNAHVNYNRLMQAPSRKKKKTGGVRYENACDIVTDYACSKGTEWASYRG